VNDAEITRRLTAVNRIFSDPSIAQVRNPLTAAGRAALDAMITQQAQIIAYIDDYKLLMIAHDRGAPAARCLKKSIRRRRLGSLGGDGINDRLSMARHGSGHAWARRQRSPRRRLCCRPIRRADA
jgi:hypothetical protein